MIESRLTALPSPGKPPTTLGMSVGYPEGGGEDVVVVSLFTDDGNAMSARFDRAEFAAFVRSV